MEELRDVFRNSNHPQPLLEKEGGVQLFPLLPEKGSKGWWSYAMCFVIPNHPQPLLEKERSRTVCSPH